MCGRYHIKDTDELTRHLRDTFKIPDWVQDRRYNIAPSQTLLLVATDEEGQPKARPMRWGLVPYWERCEKPKMAPVNARSETAFTNGMFKQSLQKRRCLIPADGFYEWKRFDPDGKRKQAYEIHLKGERPFLFAGIYEEATGLRPATFLLFTTRPNEVMQPIHDRMPVILTGDEAKRWIEPGPLAAEQFAAFAEPYSADQMEAHPVSSLVNSPKNDVPECLAPVELGQIELEPSPLPKPEQQDFGF